MKFLKRVFETERQKQDKEKQLLNIAKFNELISNYNTGESIYLRDKTNNEYGYIIKKDYDSSNYELTVHSLRHFPKFLAEDDWYDIDLCEFFNVYEIVPNDVIKEMVRKYKEKVAEQIYEVAKKIKCGIYHDKVVPPTDAKYLMNIKQVFKCNDEYYAEVSYRDFIGNSISKNKIIPITLDFFDHIEEGNGIKVISI